MGRQVLDPFQDFDKNLKEAKAQARPPLPQTVEYNQFESAPVEKPKPIIEGLLDNGSRLIFGGGSKTYKTWAMSDMALSICTGSDWWNFPTHQWVVLYVNFELKEYYCQNRFKAIRQAKGVRVPNNFFFIWNLRGYDITLLEFKDKLLSLINQYGVLVVFIDPFYRLLGDADERVSKELNPILLMFEEINRLTGATVVVAAHFTKGNQATKDPLDRISGGGNLGRNPDNILTLTKHDTDQAFTIDLIVRDFPPINPFVVKWQYPLLVTDQALDPSNIKLPPAGRPKQYSQGDILCVLRDHDDECSTTELQVAVSEETGMSTGSFYTLWKQIKASGKVFKSKLTTKWNLKL